MRASPAHEPTKWNSEKTLKKRCWRYEKKKKKNGAVLRSILILYFAVREQPESPMPSLVLRPSGFFNEWSDSMQLKLWSSCAPKHVLWQRVFRSASEFKVRNLIQWTGHFAIYVRWLFGRRYISSLHSADELQQERKQLSTVAILLYRFLSCWCLETFFRSISLAVFCLIHFHFGWSDLL